MTAAGALAANYPFATIEPNVGVVAVPDPRLEIIHSFMQTEKIIPASLRVVDIAGIVRGASTGEGLGNKFLSTSAKSTPSSVSFAASKAATSPTSKAPSIQSATSIPSTRNWLSPISKLSQAHWTKRSAWRAAATKKPPSKPKSSENVKCI